MSNIKWLPEDLEVFKMQDDGGHRQPDSDTGPLAVRPFSDLGQLISKAKMEALTKKENPSADKRLASRLKKEPSLLEPIHEYQERELFLQATRDVKPLDSSKTKEPSSSCANKSAFVNEDEQALIFKELRALVEGERPFPVHHTPEYVEWTRNGNNKGLTSRLHKGAFAVQAYCELHGMGAVEALESCEDFLAQALLENKRCVAFVHGRGLSSPREPVLKGVVLKWLTNGPYRRFILSFCSAPIWDGGAGVTYVLLRRHPAKRRRKKTGGKP